MLQFWVHGQVAPKMRLALESKQRQIVDDLIQIDRDLQNINFVRNEFQSRRLIDCRRQLLANLKALQSANEAKKNSY